MALTFGPRLGRPSSTGFSVWVKADGASTIKVETRKTGTTAWTLKATQATGTWNSAALFVTGLDANTKYDYRVLQNDVQVATNTTWTMPASGRFFMYHVSDSHNVTDTLFDNIRVHFETHVEPLGIPAFILHTGDLVGAAGGPHASATAMADAFVAQYDDPFHRFFQTTARLPFVYMFHDWDWAGNNSTYDWVTACTTRQVAVDHQAIHWQDRGPCTFLGRTINGLPYDNYTFGFEVAGVPFLVIDERSEKKQGASDELPIWQGTEPRTLWQDDLRAWMRNWLVTNADRALVMVAFGSTFRCPVVNVTSTTGGQAGAAARDGASIFHQQDLWDVFRACGESGLYSHTRKLVLLTGDDHSTWVHDGVITMPRRANDSTNVFPHPPPPGPVVPFREFKSNARSGEEALGFAIYGRGNVYDTQLADPSANSFMVWDIDATAGGRYVTARAIITESVDATPLVDEFGRTGDWWFDNGTWLTYDADSAVVDQVYPGDGGYVSPPLFDTWSLDVVEGTMHPDRSMGREPWERRLRARANFDTPSLDEQRAGWTVRVEETDPDPE